MTTRYAFGRALEYQIQADLEKFGYDTMRSSGSKGQIDVIAFRDGEYLFIQAKRRRPREVARGSAPELNPDPWNKLYDLARRNRAKALLACKQNSGVGNRYYLLTGEKVPHQRKAPLEIWIPREPGQGGLFEKPRVEIPTDDLL